MPVEFLSDEQAARYGRYPDTLSPEQLSRFFYLSAADAALLATRRRPANKLGCAVQLCTLRFLGTFLPDPFQVPAVVVDTLAAQLQLSPADWEAYRKRPSTWYEHQLYLLTYLGYRPFTPQQGFRLARWLYAQVATNTLRPSVMFDLATAHLVAQRVVLPGATQLARLIARVRQRHGLHRVLHRGRLPVHGHEQPLRIDYDMALAPSYLLAGVVAVAAPLFPPVRTACVSMAPAVGSASRPAAWRTWRRSPASNRSQVPSSRHASNCL